MKEFQRALNAFLGAPKRPRAPDSERPEREAFKRLAVKHGLDVQRTRDGYLEISPCAAFPRGLYTAFHGWPDALRRARLCLADPSAVDDSGCYSE